MLNLVKTKTKERTKSRALAGMGIGALAGVIAQGLSDDNSKDPKSYLLPMAIGAAIGGVIGGSIKTASAMQDDGEEELKPYENEPLPATDEFLRKAREVWFKDFPMEYIREFSVENVPESSKRKMLYENVMGVTNGYTYTKINTTTGEKIKYFSGKSQLFFNEKCFETPQKLFFTMGHELLHVYQNVLLKDEIFPEIKSDKDILNDLKEFYAYKFQGTFLNDPDIKYNSFTEALKICIQRYPEYYQRFNYFEFPWIKTIEFKYPF